MKKRVLFIGFIIASFFLTIILLFGLSAAANESNASSGTGSFTTPSSSFTSGTTAGNDASAISKAYQCLETQVKNKDASALSLQDAVFATLALGSRSNLESKIESEKGQNCWPKSGCKIEETGKVALAYKGSGKNTAEIEKWLASKNASAPELTWNLEIDIQNREQSDCTLRYDGTDRKVSIGNDMKISGSAGPCFSISSSGYWLTFRESCYDKEIEISCNQDFITTLLYEKKSGGTVYVTSTTNSAASLGTTKEKVSAKCFKSDASCDYEGSLWAALALYKAGHNVDAYIPYLLALAEDNKRYFPSAFLNILLSKTSGAQDQYSEIVQLQKQNKFWEIVGSPENRFYDTSLAMLALSGTNSVELENAKSYLLSIQTAEGCWNNNNIRDSAFILYGAWTRAATGSTGGGGGSTLCESVSSQSCETGDACLDAGGRILNNFQCTGFGVCCSVKVPELTCGQQNGELCANNEVCSGRSAVSADRGVCCLDSCSEREEEFTCEVLGGSCRDICSSGEQEDDSKSCSGTGEMCCFIATKEGGTNIALIVILIILIILVILAILFRHKLQIWWFRFRGKAKVTPTTRPGTPPLGRGFEFARFGQRPAGRAMPQLQRPQPITQAARTPGRRMSEKDKEMEDTLKKLREMSK